jgi:hypothetical protein
MARKALLTWNIRSGNEREHFRRVRDFVSELSTLDLELEDAWYTAYGNAPQILIGIVARDRQDEKLESTLRSAEWEQLLGELKEYITGYRQRIVEGAGRFQI